MTAQAETAGPEMATAAETLEVEIVVEVGKGVTTYTHPHNIVSMGMDMSFFGGLLVHPAPASNQIAFNAPMQWYPRHLSGLVPWAGSFGSFTFDDETGQRYQAVVRWVWPAEIRDLAESYRGHADEQEVREFLANCNAFQTIDNGPYASPEVVGHGCDEVPDFQHQEDGWYPVTGDNTLYRLLFADERPDCQLVYLPMMKRGGQPTELQEGVTTQAFPNSSCK